MTTVVIELAQVRLTPQQLVTALRQLPPDELETVIRALELPDWQSRFDTLLNRIRERAESYPISDEEITAEVESARGQSFDTRP